MAHAPAHPAPGTFASPQQYQRLLDRVTYLQRREEELMGRMQQQTAEMQVQLAGTAQADLASQLRDATQDLARMTAAYRELSARFEMLVEQLQKYEVRGQGPRAGPPWRLLPTCELGFAPGTRC
jgi:hypothetical protein